MYICGAVRMAGGPPDRMDGGRCALSRWAGSSGGRTIAMIKGNVAARVAAAKARTTTAPAKRGRPKKAAPPLPPANPMQPETPAQPFPLLIPEQLRTCLMAKDDVEAVVKAAMDEVMAKWEEKNAQRRVPLAEAMERLHVKSRSTMWHWHDRGYLIQCKDDNKHVYYPEYKIRRAERGEQPEDKNRVEGGQADGKQ